MVAVSRTRLINPRLGVYFSIFASAFVALFLLLLILEQLGVGERVLRLAMVGGPVVLFAAIGWSCYARDPLEYFAAGRRVPAVYIGLSLALTAWGATGLLAMTGAFFLIGFDALCLGIGTLAGFVAMAVLLAPYMRKSGAFTLPGYLGARFDSGAVRIIATGLLGLPMLLVLAAELQVGAMTAEILLGLPRLPALGLVAFAVLAIVAPGGMRSLTWSGIAKVIAALLALMAPVATVAVIYTALPIPQLTTGPLLRSLVRRETAEGLTSGEASALTLGLPMDGFITLSKTFATAFGSVGSLAFVLAVLSILGGVASAPWLLIRSETAPSVYAARKSLGWATLVFGIVMLTLAAIGIFMRDFTIDIVASGGAATPWLKELRALGYVSFDPAATKLSLQDIGFARDRILFALPIAAGMPVIVSILAVAGVFALALAGSASVATSLGNAVSEDGLGGLSRTLPSAQSRLWKARISLGAVLGLGIAMATLAPTDPLKLMLWSFAILGSSAFPILVMSIWWKRVNVFGAAAGLVSGVGVTIVTIIGCELGLLHPMSSEVAGLAGLPAGVLAGIVVSLVTPAPSKRVLDYVSDLRVGGGETLYDRQVRLARLAPAPQT